MVFTGDASAKKNYYLKPAKSNDKAIHLRFTDWDFFKTSFVVNTKTREAKEVCYLVSVPIANSDNRSADPKSAYRKGVPYILITNSESSIDELSVSSGFIYTDNSDVELSFGQKKFYLFPYQEIAWSYDRVEDIEILKEMQIRAEMVVTAVDKNNQLFSDRYSLIGFAQAYRKMKNECRES